MAARSLLLLLPCLLLQGWTCAQTINLQVSAIPNTATRVVAVVDQGGLAAPLRYAQNVTAGAVSTNLTLAVPAGGPYRVRAIAFVAGLAYPAILRSGKTTGVLVPNLTTVSAQIALAAINAALDAATPSSAPAGSTVTLAASIADPGDTGAGASAARLYSLSTPVPGNQLGNDRFGPFERQAEGVYRLSATIAAPPAGTAIYYQFAYNAWDFNDVNKVEQPYLFWPNLNSGGASLTLASQTSSAISVNVSGLPPAGNRIVVVVDGASLLRPVRLAKDYTPGLPSTSLTIDVPAGSGYRVRAIGFTAAGLYPAILRTGKAAGVQAPSSIAVALADPAFTLLAGTPATAPAGSTISLEAALVDPGDAAAGMTNASIHSRTTTFIRNLDGTEWPGLLESLGSGNYRFSIPVALPAAAAATTYYQFAANAFDFNDPSGSESPHFCWPDPQTGQALNQIATTLASSIRITVSGTPANATRLIAVVDEGGLAKPARAAASFVAGSPPATITVGVPTGGPYRVRLIALRSGLATPVILRSGKAAGVNVTAGPPAIATVALADYAVALDASTPASGTAGAMVTVVANVTDPGDTASGAKASRLYGAPEPFTANLSVAPLIGLLEKNANGTMKLTTPVTLPGDGGILYYQVAYEALDFSDADGVERPFFCWPNLEAAQALKQIASNANPKLLTISGSVTYNGAPLSGVLVSLSGPRTASAVTGSAGAYAFTMLPPGGYTVTPSRANFTFQPAVSTLTLTSNQTANFSVLQVKGTIGVSRTVLRFGATAGGAAATASQEVTVDISDNLPVTWSLVSDRAWLKATPPTSTGSGNFAVSLEPAAIPTAGIWPGTITLTTNTSGSARIVIQVYLAVSPSTGAPFGSFDTPTDGAKGLSSSVPVTGWTLDDVGVKKVQIWRERIGAEPVHPNGMVYIGDATFVADARPDVAALFPDRPNSYRAGWGYLMLTNFLPAPPGGRAGNGTYRIHAIASDEEGKQTDLGVRTITVDNASAVKPFGAIDTPAPGETIAGASYEVFGWALTPQPHRIADSGKDVWVVVDGAFLGTVRYNNPRGDIASLFPTYANAGGAAGYFTLDTTRFTNGMHSIAWVVTDVAGRADGIGSRYFFVRNLAPVAAEAPRPVLAMAAAPAILDDANSAIEVEELGRVELQLPPGPPWRGRLIHNEDRVPLPVGSTLDSEGGVFAWQLAPGFLGAYTLEFENSSESKTVRVVVRPQGSARELPKEGEIRF